MIVSLQNFLYPYFVTKIASFMYQAVSQNSCLLFHLLAQTLVWSWSNTIFLFRITQLNICSAHTSPSLWPQRRSWLRQGVHLKQKQGGKADWHSSWSVSLVTSFADWLSNQTLCHPSFPVPSLAVSFTACSCPCPLSMVYLLQLWFPLLPQIKLWWSVFSSLLLLFTSGPSCSASPLQQRLPYWEFVQCPSHKCNLCPFGVAYPAHPLYEESTALLPGDVTRWFWPLLSLKTQMKPHHMGAAWWWASSSRRN